MLSTGIFTYLKVINLKKKGIGYKGTGYSISLNPIAKCQALHRGSYEACVWVYHLHALRWKLSIHIFLTCPSEVIALPKIPLYS